METWTAYIRLMQNENAAILLQYHAKSATVERFDEGNWGAFWGGSWNLFSTFSFSLYHQCHFYGGYLHVSYTCFIYGNHQIWCHTSSALFRFIVLPQLINDYFLQSTTNISSRTLTIGVEQIEDSANFFDFFTGLVSFPLWDQNLRKYP